MIGPYRETPESGASEEGDKRFSVATPTPDSGLWKDESGHSSVAERHVANVEIAGSIPAVRSKKDEPEATDDQQTPNAESKPISSVSAECGSRITGDAEPARRMQTGASGSFRDRLLAQFPEGFVRDQVARKLQTAKDEAEATAIVERIKRRLR